MKNSNNEFPVYVTGVDGYRNWVRINEHGRSRKAR